MEPGRFKLGLALGGGAARGLFHVGCLRALCEAGIRPDIIAGTSVGAMIAAVYACLQDPCRLEDEVVRLRWDLDILDFRQSAFRFLGRFRDLFSRNRVRTAPGLLENSHVVKTINRLGEGRGFSEALPLIITGTDIESCEKILFCTPGIAPCLREAYRRPAGMPPEEDWRQIYDPATVVVPFENVGLAARISGCFPGVMSSVEMEVTDVDGQTRKRLLNDGGILEQVPVLPLRELGCSKVLGIHLGFIPYFNEVHNMFGVTTNSIQGIAGAQIARSLEQADYVIYDPAIETTRMHVLDRGLVEMGYRFTLGRLDAIHRALESPGSARITSLPIAG